MLLKYNINFMFKSMHNNVYSTVRKRRNFDLICIFVVVDTIKLVTKKQLRIKYNNTTYIFTLHYAL